MPLRDHFRPPLSQLASWEGLHGGWPMMLVASLVRILPARYVAEPRVHLGAFFEVDVASYEQAHEPARPIRRAWPQEESPAEMTETSGLATAVWSPPRPTLTVPTDLPDQDEYEVRVYDSEHGRRLVAAVEIVSPANKDRPEHRRVFVAKCAALLRQHVSVAIVDLVTTRQFNLYGEMLQLIGQIDPSLAPEPSRVYAAACRWRRKGEAAHLETWAHVLALGRPLPTLPLWLADDVAIPLDLETSYEETCRILRIV